MAIWVADNLSDPWPSAADQQDVTRDFAMTMLNEVGTTKLLAWDVILLAPIPTSRFVITDYYLDVPELDTATGITLNLGDNTVATGAVTGSLPSTTTTTIPSTALNTTFTLTLSASTASFATAGMVMCNGILITHTGKSGSTLTGCCCNNPSAVLPASANVVEVGNAGVASAYQLDANIGQEIEGWMFPFGNTGASGTFTAGTVTAAALPKLYPPSFNIPGSNLQANAAIGPYYFMLQVATSATTAPTYATTATKLQGWFRGHFKGY